MASLLHWWCLSFFSVAMMAVERASAAGYATPVFHTTPWQLAHATFYGDETASETMGMLLFFVLNSESTWCYLRQNSRHLYF